MNRYCTITKKNELIQSAIINAVNASYEECETNDEFAEERIAI